MELFDKRFVHFMWDDELEGKEVFVADNINSLIEHVEKGASIYKVCWSRDNGMPFESDDLVRYRFAYYDPNYDVKRAFNEGKKVQYQLVSGVDWGDIDSEEALECRIAEGRTFRIKPEEEKWIAYLARPKNGNCYLSACTDTHWESVQKNNNAKTKLFIGSESDAQHWYETREKFTEVIRAWEDGKTIQVYETLFNKWGDCAGTLEWYTDCEYRVKPECPCADGIDSKDCVGCEHNEDGKQYRPYRDALEFIADYGKRFPTATPRPLGTMPLIWIAHKTDGTTRLIVEFSDRSVKIGCKVKPVDFGKLFEYWTYTDGSPAGMEVKE